MPDVGNSRGHCKINCRDFYILKLVGGLSSSFLIPIARSEGHPAYFFYCLQGHPAYLLIGNKCVYGFQELEIYLIVGGKGV